MFDHVEKVLGQFQDLRRNAILITNLDFKINVFLAQATLFEAKHGLKDTILSTSLRYELQHLFHYLREDMKEPVAPTKEFVNLKFLDAFQNIVKNNYKCPYCPREFSASSVKSLQNHCKEYHKQEASPRCQDFPDQVRIECNWFKKGSTGNLCKKMVQRDSMIRHLETHGVKRDDKKATFRGWLLIDEIPHAVVFKRPGEANPPDEQLVEVIDATEVNIEIAENTNTQGAEVADQELHAQAAEGGEGENAEIAEQRLPDQIDRAGEGKDAENEIIQGDVNFVDPQGQVTVVMPAPPSMIFNDEPDIMPDDPILNSIENPNIDNIEFPRINMNPMEIIEDPNIDNNESPTKNMDVIEQNSSFGQIREDLIQDDDTTCFKDFGELQDSDSELNDDLYYTYNRIELKKYRQKRRNEVSPEQELCDREENAQIIEDFRKHMNNIQAAKVTQDLTFGHLFHYQESFLRYEYQQDTSFNLRRLVSFQSPEFLSIPSPTNWIRIVSGKDGKQAPSTQAEMLKEGYLYCLEFKQIWYKAF